MGYAAVGDPRKDSKELDGIEDEESVKLEDDYDKASAGSVPSGQPSLGATSPVLSREDPKPYPDNKTASHPPESELRDFKAEDIRPRREYKEVLTFSDDERSPTSVRTPHHDEQHHLAHSRSTGSPSRHTESRKVPYFRYFGPTAIVPGFKQMVVSVREHRRSMGAASSSKSSC